MANLDSQYDSQFTSLAVQSKQTNKQKTTHNQTKMLNAFFFLIFFKAPWFQIRVHIPWLTGGGWAISLLSEDVG